MNLTVENVQKVSSLKEHVLQHCDLNSSKASDASTVIIPKNTETQQDKIFKNTEMLDLELFYVGCIFLLG